MTDPFDFRTELPGGVLLRGDARGSRAARVQVGPDGLQATTDDGALHRIAWSDLRLRQAGDGDGLYCVARDRSLTIHSAHPDFARALEAAGGNDLADELSRLAGERVTSRWKHRTSCAVLLVVGLLVLWSIPRVFRGAVSAGVSVLPYSIDQAIGRSVFDQMEMGGPEVQDETVRAAIQTMLDRLAPHCGVSEATFAFRVIESAEVNAFALPGGFLVVYTGLLREADDPAEVCGVIAHEMAHATERHGLHRIAHTVGIWAAIGVLFGNTDALTSIAVQLFTLASVNDYSQSQESEADLEGARMMIAARIDPRGLVDFFSRLEETHGDVPASMAWLSTHPRHRERIAAVERYERDHGAGVAYEPLEIDWTEVQAHLR